jgi:hypothetical protein
MLQARLCAAGVLQGMPELTEGSEAEEDDWLDDEEVRQSWADVLGNSVA